MYFHKDSELFLYLRDMKENVPVIYAAPLQGFTEVAWRNAHAQMHRQMYLYYHRVIEGGEAQLLAKLKTCWEYLLPELDKKQRKAILKSNRLDGYLRAVEEALR